MKSMLKLFGLLMVAGILRAEPLPVGPGQITTANAGESLTVFTYKPPTYRGGPLFVICHGVSRNAEDYRN
ncbi:MAG: hypothetical protein H7343_04275, partial [Undibacterium sp.]|nr:hypothetical protein [Opitutaceae bacterium]